MLFLCQKKGITNKQEKKRRDNRKAEKKTKINKRKITMYQRNGVFYVFVCVYLCYFHIIWPKSDNMNVPNTRKSKVYYK